MCAEGVIHFRADAEHSSLESQSRSERAARPMYIHVYISTHAHTQVQGDMYVCVCICVCVCVCECVSVCTYRSERAARRARSAQPCLWGGRAHADRTLQVCILSEQFVEQTVRGWPMLYLCMYIYIYLYIYISISIYIYTLRELCRYAF